jgi:signal peptidase I
MTDVPETGLDVPETAPRRWWVAALLSLFGLGAAGYLYVGRPRRAVAAALVSLAFGIGFATGLGGMLVRPVPFFAALALQAVVVLFIVVDSARIALRETEYRPQPYNQTWVYAVVVVVGVLLTGVVLKPGVQSFEVATASMEPTLLEGDRILVNTNARVPKRGTLVAMFPSSSSDVAYLRRVIGIPGDRVQMINGVVQLNGAPVTLVKTGETVPGDEGTVYRETLPDGATYRILDRNPDGAYDNTGVFEIPPGLYFVLGDSRDNSTDSRMRELGGVAAENIIGTITGIYWSPDKSRIGMNVE